MSKLFLLGLFICLGFVSRAQVGIGTAAPAGVLDVTSTNSGIVLPRVAN